MSKHLITVAVDTDRDQFGASPPAGHHTDAEVRAYAETFGAGPGDQWDNPPHTHVVEVRPDRRIEVGQDSETNEPIYEDPDVDALTDREHALTQCQHIAYDGVLAIENELPGLPLSQVLPFLRGIQAKLERISNVAEAGSPDEDFREMVESVEDDLAAKDEQTTRPVCTSCGSTMAVIAYRFGEKIYGCPAHPVDR